jgi:hypothetical protein
MREAPTPLLFAEHRDQFAVALRYIEKVLMDGLRHGFFECSIACEIGNGGKRQLVIRAGKSHKFTIPKNELRRRGDDTGDPCDGDAPDENHVKVQRHRWNSETGGQGHEAARSRP